jgi:uncharacterized protein (DUF1501 family)
MSRIHFDKRRDFIKGAACLAASGAASSFVPQLSMMGTALAQAATGYKAMVCIYLSGGTDSWNLLIPVDNSTPVPVTGRTPITGQSATPYGWYVTSRGGQFQGNPSALALLRPGTDPGSPFLPPTVALNGGQYAVNPACPELANLYNNGRLAFVANIGPLVEPMRRSTFNNLRRPPQLYSHNDQTNLWQIGSGSNSTDANGFGGKIAGRVLNTAPTNGLSPCISISGQTRFLVGQYTGGQTVFPYRLSTNDTVANPPATSLNNYALTSPAGRRRLAELEGLVRDTYPQAFTNEYGDIVDRSLTISQTVNSAITSLSTNAAFSQFVTAVGAIPNTSIGRQLRQVARMIAVSRGTGFGINANRQVYYVSTGGYDTHDGQSPAVPTRAAGGTTYPAGTFAGLQRLLLEVSQAMNGFNNAMVALSNVTGYNGAQNDVLTFTMSEFARTINSNGNGTDHAWGAVNMIMGAPVSQGGPLAGGQVYGRYPLQLLNRRFATDNVATGTDLLYGECFNRGEYLPTTAVDQFSATLARWMGVSNTDLPAMFPNIDNFAAPRFNTDGVMAYSGRIIPGMLAGVT